MPGHLPGRAAFRTSSEIAENTEDDLSGRQPHWKSSSMEEVRKHLSLLFYICRSTKIFENMETTSMEDEFYVRCPNSANMEGGLNGRLGQS